MATKHIINRKRYTEIKPSELLKDPNIDARFIRMFLDMKKAEGYDIEGDEPIVIG